MSADPVEALFDAAFLGRLEALVLAARQVVRGRQRADRRSVRHGSSIEFAEYRAYVPGDDFRLIDWSAYARWRQLVLKLFIEEEDLHVHLLIDATASMDWGNPLKFDHARRLAAGLAYLGLSNLDRVSVGMLGPKLAMLPPARGQHRFFSVLRFLAAAPVQVGGGSLARAADLWQSMQPRRGLVLLLSDLWGETEGDALAAIDRLRHARHEVGVLQITDPGEREAGEAGEFELVCCETGNRRTVVADSRMAREYRQRVASYREAVTRHCRRHQVALLEAGTEIPVETLLTRALAEGGFVR